MVNVAAPKKEGPAPGLGGEPAASPKHRGEPEATRGTHGSANGRRTFLVALALAALPAGALLVGGTHIGGAEALWDLFSSPEAARALLEGLGAWAPLAFLFAQAAQVVVAVVPAAPVTLAGVAAFGPVPGFALGMAGAVAGSVAAFLLARRFGRSLVARLVGEGVLEKYAGRLGANGKWLLLALMLPIPVGGDAICALAGLSVMPTLRFALLASLGRIPWTALNVLAASGLTSGSTGLATAVGLAFLVLLALSVRYRRRIEGWLLGGGARNPNL